MKTFSVLALTFCACVGVALARPQQNIIFLGSSNGDLKCDKSELLICMLILGYPTDQCFCVHRQPVANMLSAQTFGQTVMQEESSSAHLDCPQSQQACYFIRDVPHCFCLPPPPPTNNLDCPQSQQACYYIRDVPHCFCVPPPPPANNLDCPKSEQFCPLFMGAPQCVCLNDPKCPQTHQICPLIRDVPHCICLPLQTKDSTQSAVVQANTGSNLDCPPKEQFCPIVLGSPQCVCLYDPACPKEQTFCPLVLGVPHCICLPPGFSITAPAPKTINTANPHQTSAAMQETSNPDCTPDQIQICPYMIRDVPQCFCIPCPKERQFCYLIRDVPHCICLPPLQDTKGIPESNPDCTPDQIQICPYMIRDVPQCFCIPCPKKRQFCPLVLGVPHCICLPPPGDTKGIPENKLM